MRIEVGVLVLAVAGLGCEGTSGIDGGTDQLDAGNQRCEAAASVACKEQQELEQSLKSVVSTKAITNEEVDGAFESHIDATAGGMNPTESFIYARFTDTGLTKVEISDLDALASTDWDIGLRRSNIHLNSGVAGPSCIQAASIGADTAFGTLAAVPSGLTMKAEEYYDSACAVVPDDHGLGAPATLLSSYWDYAMCLSMTKNVYVVQLADGRHLKLQVMSYYPPENQTACDTTGTVSTPSGAANFILRWAFLP